MSLSDCDDDGDDDDDEEEEEEMSETRQKMMEWFNVSIPVKDPFTLVICAIAVYVGLHICDPVISVRVLSLFHNNSGDYSWCIYCC